MNIQEEVVELRKELQSFRNQSYEWANTIFKEQQSIKNSLGLLDISMPFEPYYNRHVELSSDYPEIYNRYGERMKVFFIHDYQLAPEPYWGTDRYIYWDRYNYGLKTHFYSHGQIFDTVGKPDRKFAFLIESRAILPQSYENCIQERSYIENEFEYIFTYDNRVLETISNAKFVPFCAKVWYGTRKEGVKVSSNNFKNKNKGISIISSAKEMCDLHKIRKNVATLCKLNGWADTYGTFDGGAWSPPEDSLEFYRYSIVIENDITPYFFTEKITNCFLAQTIPIYLGATKIHEFFNPDGIIVLPLNDIDKIDKILAQCTPEEYERRLPAVKDNFERVQKYLNPMDYMYEKYLSSYFEEA